MSGNGNQVPLAPNQRGPGPYPRAPTPRAECYHSPTAGPSYMPNTAGGGQGSAQATLRVQPTPQQTPQAPQQDPTKTTMAGHSFVSQPPSGQARQYSNYSYRTTQHTTRPNAHPRQQQSFISSAAAPATGPVMYSTLLFPHMPYNQQTYQQQRSQGYYPYPMAQFVNYTPPTGHTPASYYYPSNNQQMSAPNIQTNQPGARGNPSSLMGPQGTSGTPAGASGSIPLPQAQSHMHQTMPGVRPPVAKRSHRVPIIHPLTQKEVNPNDSSSQHVRGDSSERQTPETSHGYSIAEEFSRMVNEAANQPSHETPITKSSNVKSTDLSISSTASSMQPQSSVINTSSNILVKSDISTLAINDKNLGPDFAVDTIETPVVSAISDSPVIVPKMPKQIQKNSDQFVQSIVIDSSKVPPNKLQKQNKKPFVPQNEEPESSENIISNNSQALPVVSTSISTDLPTNVPVPLQTVVSSLPLTTGNILSSVPVLTPVSPPSTFLPTSSLTPQPQRVREPRERLRVDEKHNAETKSREIQEVESSPTTNACNGPVCTIVENISAAIETPSSQNTQIANEETSNKQEITTTTLENKTDSENTEVIKSEQIVISPQPTATQRLSASIEKLVKDQPIVSETVSENKESSSVIEAQAKLTQSITSCLQIDQLQPKMKDINVKNKPIDPDTANGNTTAETSKDDIVIEDINKNEKNIKNTKNTSQQSSKISNNTHEQQSESYENGKTETDNIGNEEQENVLLNKEEPRTSTTLPVDKVDSQVAPVFVPKYKYNEDQWSPLNKTGKKCYDVDLLKQIKDDPLSKKKPTAPLLDLWNVSRTAPLQEHLTFAAMSRTMNDTILPSFLKNAGMGARTNAPRDIKKEGRTMAVSGKGSMKQAPPPVSGSGHKQVIHLSLREDVKLNEIENAWKPARFKKENLNEEELKTQELYKNFRGILNKLTPQKFNTLLEKVKGLDINTQKRLKGVIDLIFEKAIDEPNFSEAYALMCNKLSMIKVPVDNATSPDQWVNFRGLIISKCQAQFVTDKVDEQVLKLEGEIAECQDPAKKKELQLQLEEENRRVRMRSVGNVRFIGELYKLKMLTAKIMVYCMNYLIEKLEEEKLECLCKLLTTIGEQVESEVKEPLENVFKQMQDIVDRKSNQISSRVRFMLQDVIALKRRNWVVKSVVDSQPKMMDQIQKEAEQQQRHIELMNASPTGSFRRDEGSRGKRGGDNRRQNSNSYMDSSNYKSNRNAIDMSKLKMVSSKNLVNSDIKLAPPSHSSLWNHGARAKSTIAQAASNSMISLSKNMYSALENVQADPTLLRANKVVSPSFPKGASIERSTFASRPDYTSSNAGNAGFITGRSNSGIGTSNAATPTPTVSSEPANTAAVSVPQEPMTDALKKSVQSTVKLCVINSDVDEMITDVKQLFQPKYHAALISEILNTILEKSAKEVALIAKAIVQLVTTNTISSENLIAGIAETLDIAPDLYIDIPMLYDYLAKFIVPLIEKKYISFKQILGLSGNIISANQGHIFLKILIRDLKDSMGPSFVKNKWQESGLQVKDWMNEDQVLKWIEDNKFEFLNGIVRTNEEMKKILTPDETQTKLLELMNSDMSCECIREWVHDNLGKSSNEDWFMRALIQAICEHALSDVEHAHFNQDRMNKYSTLINEFADGQRDREVSCLFGIQQLIHRLEHPQGLSLEIFQYLHEQYIISVDGFSAWGESELEPEGKGVMMKALTSFFTSLKEADNEDSCSED